MSDFRPAGWTGQPTGDPGATPAGWAAGQPTVTVGRRRSPVLIGLGIALVVGSAVAITLSIVDFARTGGYDDEDVVAEGVVAALDQDGGEVATFTSGGRDPFTVWIRTDGINEENRRENVIAATACQAFHGADDGDPASFQGNRQGNAITIEDDSTVGWFTAEEGEVSVVCHQEPFGQRRTRGWLTDEHDFVVVEGKPKALLGSILVTSAAAIGLILGIGLLGRGLRGRVGSV